MGAGNTVTVRNTLDYLSGGNKYNNCINRSPLVDGYEVTMQIYAPKGGGSTTAIDTSNNNANIVSAKGKTKFQNAMIHATALQGEYIFAGHNRLLILGEEFAKQGVENVFSYFDRNHLTRQNIDVLVSKGKAKDIVALNIDQGILAAETLEKRWKTVKQTAISPVLRTISSAGICFFIMAVRQFR